MRRLLCACRQRRRKNARPQCAFGVWFSMPISCSCVYIYTFIQIDIYKYIYVYTDIVKYLHSSCRRALGAKPGSTAKKSRLAMHICIYICINVYFCFYACIEALISSLSNFAAELRSKQDICPFDSNIYTRSHILSCSIRFAAFRSDLLNILFDSLPAGPRGNNGASGRSFRTRQQGPR